MSWSPAASSTGPATTVPCAPNGWVPTNVPERAGAFRMFVTSVVCTRSPMTNLFAAAGVTVMPEVPLCPSLVAVIVADPAPVAVTNPVALTVAAEPLLVDQVTGRPTNGLGCVLGRGCELRGLPGLQVDRRRTDGHRRDRGVRDRDA